MRRKGKVQQVGRPACGTHREPTAVGQPIAGYCFTRKAHRVVSNLQGLARGGQHAAAAAPPPAPAAAAAASVNDLHGRARAIAIAISAPSPISAAAGGPSGRLARSTHLAEGWEAGASPTGCAGRADIAPSLVPRYRHATAICGGCRVCQQW